MARAVTPPRWRTGAEEGASRVTTPMLAEDSPARGGKPYGERESTTQRRRKAAPKWRHRGFLPPDQSSLHGRPTLRGQQARGKPGLRQEERPAKMERVAREFACRSDGVSETGPERSNLTHGRKDSRLSAAKQIAQDASHRVWGEHRECRQQGTAMEVHTAQGADGVEGWASLVVVAVGLGFAIWRYLLAMRHRPRLARQDVVYQEWFASGWSERNLLTKLGGARNCLRLVMTRELLWVTSWPPFSLLTPVGDLEHVIPLQSITELRHSRTWWVETLLLTYVDASGRRHRLGLVPKHPARFLQALGRPAEG